MPRTSPPASKRTPAPRSAAQAQATHSTLVETAELAPHLGDPRLVIVDVRHDLADPAFGEAAYVKSHIPGAVFAHVDRDLSAPRSPQSGRHPLPTPEAAARFFARLGIDATKQVVAYDQISGVYASRLWWMLRWLGHDSVAVLDGGFAKWTREGRPVSTDVPQTSPTKFVAARVLPTVNATGIAASLPRHGGQAHWDWLYVHNPDGPARAWLAEDDGGEAVGVAAAFPRRVWIEGREHTCWNLGDFAIRPDHRSLGPAVRLQRAAVAAVRLLAPTTRLSKRYVGWSGLMRAPRHHSRACAAPAPRCP